MRVFPCPSCGAQVKFQSAVSVFSVCSYCRSMLVREDLELKNLGKMAVLQEDMSPLQIGTEGKFEKGVFTIIGRIKMGWEDGKWNEWHLFFDKEQTGWLAEAQGFYSICREVTLPDNFPPEKTMQVGNQVNLHGILFEVEDRREAWCLGSEGELPFRAVKGWKHFSIDLTGPDSSFASLSYSDEGVKGYVGKTLDFEQYHFARLRELDGWSTTS